MTEMLFAAGGQIGTGSPNQIMTFLPFLLIIVIMYFLMIRPQAKKQKEKQRMLQELKVGDEVVTIGGIFGKIEGIREKDNIIILGVAKDIKIRMMRSAISEKLAKPID